MPTLTVLDIQRMSSEDGPGLRTTVFLKGCPLRCRWCHNPESIAPQGEILRHAARCMGCGSCGDFRNYEACPTGALEFKGTPWDCETLCRELLKDRAYWGGAGGVTLSGGEPLMQEAAVDLLRLLKAQGAHSRQRNFVALDTCGLVPEARLRAALECCDMVLYDLKFADSARHKEWTGAGNEAILKNLQFVSAWARAGAGRLWVRTPIIPGATDDDENIRAIGEILARLNGIERWELCAFNNLCGAKYQSLGRAWEFEGVPLVTRTKMDELLAIAKSTNACPDIRWTGAVKD